MVHLGLGLPALITLVIVTFLAVTVGIAFSPNGRKGDIRLFYNQSPPPIRALVTATVALPFWIWAIWNVKNKSPDLGAISFLFVLISCLIVYRAQPNATLPPYLLLVSNAIVSLNYALPLFLLPLPNTFLVYLGIGAIYWAFMCCWNWRGYSSYPSHDFIDPI